MFFFVCLPPFVFTAFPCVLFNLFFPILSLFFFLCVLLVSSLLFFFCLFAASEMEINTAADHAHVSLT